ncbi:MAG: VOC family protein [Micropruina sp.]|nr:VOC family protein [Micropruina sp.]
MALEFQVTFDCADPRTLSMFWRDVLGYVHPAPPGVEVGPNDDPLDAWEEFLEKVGVPPEERNSSSALIDPDGRGPRIFFQQVPEPKQVKNRLHLDVRGAPGLTGDERMASLEAECERVVGLGATRVHRFEAEGIEQGFILMHDPEGNEFCLD